MKWVCLACAWGISWTIGAQTLYQEAQGLTSEQKQFLAPYLEEVSTLLPPILTASMPSISLLFLSGEEPKRGLRYSPRSHQISLSINLLSDPILLKFALVQETARAYDMENLRTPLEQETFVACKKDATRCEGVSRVKHRRTSISDHLSYKHMTRNRKNLQDFSRVFASFLLEPEKFRLQYPRLHQFLSAHFSSSPTEKTFEEVRKKSSSLTQIPLLDFPTYVKGDFSPNKVDRIDFFLVAPGSASESRFGHVSLRFSMCAKELRPGERCEETDRDLDFVVAYTADLQRELGVNPIKGLLGQYKTMTSIVYLENALDMYVYLENRTMEAYPLKLTWEQQQALTWQVITDFWSFRGQYHIMSRNCSTEVRDILRSILGIHNFSTHRPIRPIGLKNLLIQHHLIDPEPEDIYDSARDMIAEGLRLALNRKPKKSEIDLLPTLEAGARIAWYRAHQDRGAEVVDRIEPDMTATIDCLAWSNLEKEVRRIRRIRKQHQLVCQHAHVLHELVQHIDITPEGEGIPSAYNVFMPTETPPPYQEELNKFKAEEATVLTELCR